MGDYVTFYRRFNHPRSIFDHFLGMSLYRLRSVDGVIGLGDSDGHFELGMACGRIERSGLLKE